MINLIVAHDIRKGIGIGNTLPWSLPNDLKMFKEKTMGKPVVMGRKTFESIGKPLPGRENIILTRNAHGTPRDEAFIKTCSNIDYVLARGVKEDIFVIGGEQTYRQFMPYADRIYLTIVHNVFNCDTFFPSIIGKYKIIESTVNEADERNLYKHTFMILEKCY